MASFIDHQGQTQQIKLEPSIYREAHLAGRTVEQHLNLTYPTRSGDASAFDQVCASEGMFVGRNEQFGVRPATMQAIIHGADRFEAGVIVKEANPASRILFPAFQLAAIENKLRNDDYGITGLFESHAAVVDTINDEKFERPILNFSKPEAARSKPIAQLSEPASMLSITASDKSWRITGTSIGMEISDQALKITSLDLVNMAMTRQAETERLEKVEQAMLAFYNGDTDLDMTALSAVAGAVKTATSYDSTIANAAGVLTQKAWVKWLFDGSRKRKVDTVICTLDTLLSIQNRTGRPTVQQDNPNSKRVDTLEDVVNPHWPDKIDIFLSLDPNFPANTILGFDSRYGYHVVKSAVLDYQAAEAYAIRRSTKYRIDSGMIAYRLFDEAWSVMTLT